MFDTIFMNNGFSVFYSGVFLESFSTQDESNQYILQMKTELYEMSARYDTEYSLTM